MGNNIGARIKIKNVITPIPIAEFLENPEKLIKDRRTSVFDKRNIICTFLCERSLILFHSRCFRA